MHITQMNIMKKVPDSMVRTASRQLLQAKKQSPHIFFGAGVIGVITSTVLACRATVKLSKTLDDIQHDVDVMKAPRLVKNSPETVVHVDDQWRTEAVGVYSKAGFQIAKLYGPSVVVGIVSIAALTGSHVQLTRRNTALMAAYAAVQKAYDDYRERVRDELGEEKELDIYHSAESKTVNKEIVKTVDPNTYSPYAKFFDEYSSNWKKDPESNRLFVLCQQNYANNLLQARGHLFLNEVYDMLDVGRTKAGSVVGWVIGKEGDNYVNFGVYEAFNSMFVNGHERSVVLDFNVDGVIYDKL